VKLVARFKMQFRMANIYHSDTVHDTVALDASLDCGSVV
jgi:hypothetical protein